MSAPPASPTLDDDATGAPVAPSIDATGEDPGEALGPRARKLVLAGFAITTAAGTAGIAFLPYLVVSQPELLLLTSSDGRNLVLAATKLDLLTVLAIAVPRRVVAMAVTWGLGRLYGRKLLGWTERQWPSIRRAVAWFERLFLRYRRALLLFWPTYMTAALAGVTRTPWRVFLPWMIAGQIGYVVVSYMLGDALGAWITQAIDWLSGYVWEATGLTLGAVAIQQLVAYVRRRRAVRNAATA